MTSLSSHLQHVRIRQTQTIFGQQVGDVVVLSVVGVILIRLSEGRQGCTLYTHYNVCVHLVIELLLPQLNIDIATNMETVSLLN